MNGRFFVDSTIRRRGRDVSLGSIRTFGAKID
jgi:hypothetical protein